jgi:hypothetical protein
MHLFTEVFPIENPPTLTAYHLCLYPLPPEVKVTADEIQKLARTLVARLRKALPGDWLWSDDRVLTDTPALPFEIDGTVESLKAADPDYIGVIERLAADMMWMPTPEQTADFVIRTRLKLLDDTFTRALEKFNRESFKNARIEREYKTAPWNCGGLPAVSLSVAARLVAEQDAQGYAAQRGTADLLLGLRASDKFSSTTGEIIKITGRVGDRREKLLKSAGKDGLRRLLQHAADDEWTVRIETSSRRQEYPASALELLIRPVDFVRFGIDEQQANIALRPDPTLRSQMIKALSDIAKERGFLGRGFSAREHSSLFNVPDFRPYLRYANGRTKPYASGKLAVDFVQCGAHHVREVFASAPLRIAVVNTLSYRVEDFVEALRRQLTKTANFSIDVIRERKVRVVSLENIESAVRVLEKENPDMILSFVPDANRTQEGENLPAFVKSLTLGRGIPAQVIFESVLDDPDAMPGIVMEILAKTGNTPFALADPLEFADEVVGLALVTSDDEDEEADTGQITGIARIYRANGQFVRYAMRSVELSKHDGVTAPELFVLMRDLFPQKMFAGRRVVLHVEDPLPETVRQALDMWGKAIRATFMVVEVLRKGAPRLYCLSDGRIHAPPWGSSFHLNERECFTVLDLEDEEDAPVHPDFVPDVPAPDFDDYISDDDASHPAANGRNTQTMAAARTQTMRTQAVRSTQTQTRKQVKPEAPRLPTPQPLHIVAHGLSIEQAVRSLQLWTLLYYRGTGTQPLPVTLYGAGELIYWLRKGGKMQSPEGEFPFWL